VAVVSPVALTEEVKAKVEELGGPVKYIIAPDFEHHIFVSDWAKEYPEAKLIGVEGLPEKRLADSDPRIGNESFDVVFNAKNKLKVKISEEFDQDFEYEYVETHPNKELVFFYKPDKILVEADLMFNLPAIEQYSRVPKDQIKGGILNSIFNSLQTTKGDAKSLKRFSWYVASKANRPAYNVSMKKIDSWDFNTIIPCHGETIEGNGKEVFEKVFEWHLKGHK
jgi:hypothetical protein